MVPEEDVAVFLVNNEQRPGRRVDPGESGRGRSPVLVLSVRLQKPRAEAAGI